MKKKTFFSATQYQIIPFFFHTFLEIQTGRTGVEPVSQESKSYVLTIVRTPFKKTIRIELISDVSYFNHL